ncbi:molybdenum cofactor guanylyltransferase [Kineococcus sp. SYSU DK004]|uniref:molybdenum cofactor guanylyltransferase n=1 Tax=Kineococcus sp. SYSU DK004 TaxID=3383125 RepID=UPI003D7D2120
MGDGTAVVVVAGGAGSRFTAAGGAGDKLDADVGGRPVLGALLRALADAGPERVVLVGPARDLPAHLAARVERVREDPPGGGPLAALAAGLRHLAATGAGRGCAVALLAGDQPFAASALPRLLGALEPAGGAAPALAAVGVDPSGRRQPLLAAVRLGAALDALAGCAVDGRPVRELYARLDAGSRGAVAEVPVSDRERLDVDVPADLAAAREAARDTSARGPRPGAGRGRPT